MDAAFQGKALFYVSLLSLYMTALPIPTINAKSLGALPVFFDLAGERFTLLLKPMSIYTGFINKSVNKSNCFNTTVS